MSMKRIMPCIVRVAAVAAVLALCGCATNPAATLPPEMSHAEFLREVIALTEQPIGFRESYASEIPSIIADLKNATLLVTEAPGALARYPEYVHAYGSTLERHGYTDGDAATVGNPSYWQAVIALTGNDITAMLVRLLLLMSAGDLARAEVLLLYCLYNHNAAWERDMRLLSRVQSDIAGIRRRSSTHIERGIALWDRGKRAEALSMYRTALDLYPKSPWAVWQLGLDRLVSDFGFQDSPEFRRLYAHIRALDPHYELAWYQGISTTGHEFALARTVSEEVLPSARALFQGQNPIANMRRLADGYHRIEEYELAFYAYKHVLFNTYTGSFDLDIADGLRACLKAMEMGQLVPYFDQLLADIEETIRP